MLSAGCKEKQARIDVWIEPGNTAVHIPLTRLPQYDGNIDQHLKIRMHENATDMLGDYRVSDDIVFTPVIPFTAGTLYDYLFDGKLIDSFKIAAVTAGSPRLVAVYPLPGEIPVNLLKIYLEFSQPMRESVSGQFISLVKAGTDTLKDVFLDLQPELWNQERTVLTVWLDPGRIKRDLQPNQRLGAPLDEKNSYQFIVKKGWQSAKGTALEKNTSVLWKTTNRDSLSPDPALWRLQVPGEASADALIIDLNESLDHFLLAESIHIQAPGGTEIKGQIQTDQFDRRLQFKPAAAWKSGDYKLVIDGRLEDLAGNNLNRPFDRDITTTKARQAVSTYSRNFRVGK